MVEALDPAMMAAVSGVPELAAVADDAAVAAQLALVTVAKSMAGIVACPSCGKNCVPAASGSPVCAACRTALFWLVEATHDDLDAAYSTRTSRWSSTSGPWCGHVAWSPDPEQLAAERAGQLKIVKVNVDELPGVSARYGVQGIPTLFFSAMATRSLRQVGAAPRHALERWLDPMSVSSMTVVDRGGPFGPGLGGKRCPWRHD